MKMATCFTTAALALASTTASAAVIDDFESGSFDASWATTSGATVGTLAGTGSGGSDDWADIIAGGDLPDVLGGFFDAPASPVSDFVLDFDVRIMDTASRAMNVQVGASDDPGTSTDGATINLRYDTGGFAAFDGGSWVGIAGLGSISHSEWHHIQITGSDWGTASASYDITVTRADTTVSAVTGLTTYHIGDPTVDGAGGFNFNARFGGNPGFDVDNVSAGVVPEPGSLALLGLGGLALLRRRRA